MRVCTFLPLHGRSHLSKKTALYCFFVCVKNEAIRLFDLNIKRSSGDFIGFLVKASVVVFQAYFHFHHKICV